ncbi:MAG: DUF2911 domain-containing protein [Myxococcota bacterium]
MRNSLKWMSVVLLAGCSAAPVASAPAAPAPQTVIVMPSSNQPTDPEVIGEFPTLPSPSPAASVSQRVGLTDIKVVYSSPGVKDRKIFGELVPFDKPWRTGANAPTTVEFSRNVTVGGKDLAAGTYSVFTIPGTKMWKMILNKDPERKGVFEHNPALDVATVEVAPEVVPARERMTFMFANTTDNGTDLVLEWNTTHVKLPISVNTEEHVAQSIKGTLEHAWRPRFNVARYYAGKGDADRAVRLFEQSIEIQPTFWNHFFLATTLKEKGDAEGAKKNATTAIKLGEGAPVFERAFRKQAEEIASGSSKTPKES